MAEGRGVELSESGISRNAWFKRKHELISHVAVYCVWPLPVMDVKRGHPVPPFSWFLTSIWFEVKELFG